MKLNLFILLIALASFIMSTTSTFLPIMGPGPEIPPHHRLPMGHGPVVIPHHHRHIPMGPGPEIPPNRGKGPKPRRL